MHTVTYIFFGIVSVCTLMLCMLDPPASFIAAAFYAGFSCGVILILLCDVYQFLLTKFLGD